MAVNVERLVQRHIDRWAYLLGLGSWKITWELTDDPIDKDKPIAHNAYYVRRNGKREAHVRFYRARLRSASQVEHAVLHELLHTFDHGIGNDGHKLIGRLETPLIRLRRRAARR